MRLAQHPVSSLSWSLRGAGWLQLVLMRPTSGFNPRGDQLASLGSTTRGGTQPQSLRALPAKVSGQGGGWGLRAPHARASAGETATPRGALIPAKVSLVFSRITHSTLPDEVCVFRIFLFHSINGYLPSICYALRTVIHFSSNPGSSLGGSAIRSAASIQEDAL